MSVGDPYCPIHGFTRCNCFEPPWGVDPKLFKPGVNPELLRRVHLDPLDSRIESVLGPGDSHDLLKRQLADAMARELDDSMMKGIDASLIHDPDPFHPMVPNLGPEDEPDPDVIRETSPPDPDPWLVKREGPPLMQEIEEAREARLPHPLGWDEDCHGEKAVRKAFDRPVYSKKDMKAMDSPLPPEREDPLPPVPKPTKNYSRADFKHPPIEYPPECPCLWGEIPAGTDGKCPKCRKDLKLSHWYRLNEFEADPDAFRDEFEGIEPPSPEAIKVAKALGMIIMEPLRTVPTGEGGIVFEWRREDARHFLALEITRGGQIEFRYFEDDELKTRAPGIPIIKAPDHRASGRLSDFPPAPETPPNRIPGVIECYGCCARKPWSDMYKSLGQRYYCSDCWANLGHYREDVPPNIVRGEE